MLAGRSLPHAAMMMIPEAYRDRDDLPDDLKGFYAFHSCLMEPWDGPAAVCFTDGRVVGATLDRNGLRPGRWCETKDGHVILGSETGMLPILPENVKRLGRLAPGKLFLVDLEQGRIVDDDEVKREVATQQPYGEWYERQRRALRRARARDRDDDRRRAVAPAPPGVRLHPGGPARPDRADGRQGRGADRLDGQRHRAGGALRTSARRCSPTSSSSSRRSPTRRSTRSASRSSCRWAPASAPSGNLLDESPEHAHQLVMDQPILRNHELETLRHVAHDVFKRPHDRHHLAGRRRPEGMSPRAGRGLRRGQRRDRRRRQHPDPLRPGREGRPRADPVAAGGRRRPPPPRARGHAPARRPRARVRRAARGPPLRHADRLRRERDQPVPAVRDGRRAGRRGPGAGRDRPRRRRAAHRQGRSARACSRRSRRWGSRRSSPTTARRSSRPSGSTRT